MRRAEGAGRHAEARLEGPRQMRLVAESGRGGDIARHVAAP